MEWEVQKLQSYFYYQFGELGSHAPIFCFCNLASQGLSILISFHVISSHHMYGVPTFSHFNFCKFTDITTLYSLPILFISLVDIQIYSSSSPLPQHNIIIIIMINCVDFVNSHFPYYISPYLDWTEKKTNENRSLWAFKQKSRIGPTRI